MIEVIDENSCYVKLLLMLHGWDSQWITQSYPWKAQDSPPCSRCKKQGNEHTRIHRDARAPAIDYHCKKCDSVFNGWTGTVFQGTHRKPSQLVVIIWAIAKDVPTIKLANFLHWNRSWLIQIRRRIKQEDWFQKLCQDQLPKIRLPSLENEITREVRLRLCPPHKRLRR